MAKGAVTPGAGPRAQGPGVVITVANAEIGDDTGTWAAGSCIISR